MDEKPPMPPETTDAEKVVAAPKVQTKKPPKKKAKPKRAAGKKKRGPAKTKPYPAIPLERALVVPLEIKNKNAGHAWPPADVAAAIGMGAKSSDFFYLTAAARDFGITTGTRNTDLIALTELGREIVYAPSPEVEHQKKVEAFHQIEIFSRVLAHYRGSDLPEMKYLGNTLEREFGLDPEFHEEFSRVFRENCDYLKIGSETAEPGTDRPGTVVVGEPSNRSALKAFVIMPFVEKDAQRSSGFYTEVLNSLIIPAGTTASFTVRTANRQGSDIIQSTIINDLLDADLVIADLTDHNPNVMFELGLRMAQDKPVALIKAKGTGRIFDVDNLLRVWEYNPSLWRSTVETDLPELTEHIKATWDNRDNAQSYMKILRAVPQERPK